MKETDWLKKRLELAENCIYDIEYAAAKAGSNDRIDQIIEEYYNDVKEMTKERAAEENEIKKQAVEEYAELLQTYIAAHPCYNELERSLMVLINDALEGYNDRYLSHS